MISMTNFAILGSKYAIIIVSIIVISTAFLSVLGFSITLSSLIIDFPFDRLICSCVLRTLTLNIPSFQNIKSLGFI